MSVPDRSKKLSNAVAFLFLVVIYTGMAMIFHSPEEGFSWFINFLLLTVVVLAGFAAIVVFLARRAKRPESTESAESSQDQ